MRVLITGATGLVGTKLVEQLLSEGTEVHYLTTSQHKMKSNPGYVGFYWNPESGIIDENALMGVDSIIHLAGASVAKRWTPQYKEEIIESRTLTASLLFKALKSHPNQVQNIISASAIGIYPDSLSDTYTEDAEDISDDFLGNVVTKWEESIEKFHLLGINVCKIRIGLVLSKEGGALTEMMKPVRLGLGAAFGDGRQYQSWIHIDDLVGIFKMALKENWKGIYNGVAPVPVTNKELIRSIAGKLNKPFFLPGIPRGVMKLILGEMHTILYMSQKVSADKVLKEGYVYLYADLDTALTDLLGKH